MVDHMTDSCKSPSAGLEKGLLLTLSVPRVTNISFLPSSTEKVRGMVKLIIKGEMLSYFIKFSELIDSEKKYMEMDLENFHVDIGA